MTTVREVLTRHNVDLSEAEVAEELDRALSAVPGIGAAPLSTAEREYLLKHGGREAGIALGREPVRTRTERAAGVVADVDQLLAGTWTVEQTAAFLGVDRSRISHRIADRSLYSIRVGNRGRVPNWQFADGAVLPSLPAIVAAISPDAHPLDVAALMMTPQDEISGRTPVEHLSSGGTPEPVVGLIEALTRW